MLPIPLPTLFISLSVLENYTRFISDTSKRSNFTIKRVERCKSFLMYSWNLNQSLITKSLTALTEMKLNKAKWTFPQFSWLQIQDKWWIVCKSAVFNHHSLYSYIHPSWIDFMLRRRRSLLQRMCKMHQYLLQISSDQSLQNWSCMNFLNMRFRLVNYCSISSIWTYRAFISIHCIISTLDDFHTLGLMQLMD